MTCINDAFRKNYFVFIIISLLLFSCCFGKGVILNQTQLVFDKNDVDSVVPSVDAKNRIASALNGYSDATVKSPMKQLRISLGTILLQ